MIENFEDQEILQGSERRKDETFRAKNSATRLE
jgi:hypothetical protein